MTCAARRLFFTSLAWLSLSALAAHADDIADFYRGKTVTIFVGLPPGGSFDLYARLVGAHLGRHIPGQPTVVVQIEAIPKTATGKTMRSELATLVEQGLAATPPTT